MAGEAMSRIERLAALLDEPLLVTSGVNVRYLIGLQSSNAAVLVEPDGEATLYTDFRYAQKARALEGVRFEQTARAVIGDLSTRLAGRTIWIEGHVVTVAANEQLREGGVDTVPQSGLVERLRAIKEPGEIATIREAAAISDKVFTALADEQFTGRTERELAWRVRELFHEHGGSELCVRHDRRRGRERRQPACGCPRRRDPGEHARHDRRRLPHRRLRVRLHPHLSRPVTCRTSSRARTRSASKRSSPGSRRTAPASAGATPTPPRAIVIAAAGFGENFGHGLGHGIGLEVHEQPAARAESTDTFEAGNVISCEPGIYIPGRRRRPDRGHGARHRRRQREAHARGQAADDRQVTCARRGRRRQHQRVQDRDAHRARGLGLADRRLPAREAGQGRRLRAHEGEEHRLGLGRRQDVPGGREVPARLHRGQEHAVPLRLRRRGRLHGRADVRADVAAARVARGRAAVHAAFDPGAAPLRRRQAVRRAAARRRSSSRSPTPSRA